MKEVEFNPDGAKLSINVEMKGLYFITYTYRLWASTDIEPPILTNPEKQGSNESPHDDRYPVKSDYNAGEPVSANHQRVIDVRYWVKKAESDDGYNLSVVVYQGENEIGRDSIAGSVGGSNKNEFITIKLIAK